MCNKYDGFIELLLNGDQFKLHALTHQWIQRREGLIHQEDVRVVGKGAGNAHALAHAAGEIGDIFIFPAVKANHINHLHGLIEALLLFDTAYLQPERYVIQYAAVRQEAKALEYHGHFTAAEFAQLLGAVLSNVFIFKQYLARGGTPQHIEASDDSGLARTAGTDQGEYLAAFHVKAHVIHGNGDAGTFEDSSLVRPFFQHLVCRFLAASEHLGEVFHLKDDVFFLRGGFICVVKRHCFSPPSPCFA